jgi:hypothetical protein
MMMTPKHQTIQFGASHNEFSHTSPTRNSRQYNTLRALQNGHIFADVERFRTHVKQLKEKPLPFGQFKHSLPTFQDYQNQQNDILTKLQEAHEHSINKSKFSFTYDAEIETDTLEPDQVYNDLKQLDEILSKNQQSPLNRATFRRKATKARSP